MAVTNPLEFYDDAFWSEIFPKAFDTSDPDNFPGFLGSNHAGAHARGPLKDNWTKACPLDWTQKERDEKCIPLQEIIYGIKRLNRLEAIKEAIDPNYMFDCTGCISNNRVKSIPAPDTPPSPTTLADPPATLSPSTSSAFKLTTGLVLGSDGSHYPVFWSSH